MTYTRGYLQLPPVLCNKPCGVCMLCKCCELAIDDNCKLSQKVNKKRDNSKSGNIKLRSQVKHASGKKNVPVKGNRQYKAYNTPKVTVTAI